MKFYVTFPLGGALRDRYTTVEARDEYVARLAVVAVYGTAGFAGLYREDECSRAIDPYNLSFVQFGVGRLESAPVRP